MQHRFANSITTTCCGLVANLLAVLLTSPQQVGNFPVYGEVTGKRVQLILDIMHIGIHVTSNRAWRTCRSQPLCCLHIIFSRSKYPTQYDRLSQQQLIFLLLLLGEPVSRRRVFLLVYVHSAPEHYAKRLLLRQTWAKPRLYDFDIRIAFFVGRRAGDAVLDQAVHLEATQFGDIIQVGLCCPITLIRVLDEYLNEAVV